jgi:hypothetical protein
MRLALRLRRLQERLVQECHQRHNGLQRPQQLLVESAGRRERRRIFATAEKLAVHQVRGRGMILGEPARDARHGVALQPAKLLESRRRHDRIKPPMVGGHVLPNQVQLRGIRRPEPAADPHPRRRDFEVKTGAIQAAERAIRKRGADVRLQRRLVFAEPRIAELAEQRHLGIGDEIRRERRQVAGEPLDDGDHRSAAVRLVLTFTFVKPFAVVVALQ